MTTTTRNEAAERLRDAIWAAPNDLGLYVKDLDEALAAERKAIVERIRTAALAKRKGWGAEGLPASLEAILDEEGAA